jgi:hypothetical protein
MTLLFVEKRRLIHPCELLRPAAVADLAVVAQQSDNLIVGSDQYQDAMLPRRHLITGHWSLLTDSGS